MTRRSRGLRIAAALAVVVGALCAPAVTAAPASAHDALVSADPAAGSTVATTPASVTLTFDEPALAVGTTLRVTGPAGDVQQGPPTLVDLDVTQPLAPGAPGGSYHVAWRVTSADGHPVSGEFDFTATAANARAAGTAAAAPAGSAAAGSTPTAGSSSSSLPVLPITIAVVVLLGLGGALWARRRPPGIPDGQAGATSNRS